MKTEAAVLRESRKPAPYATSRPLEIEEVELDPPGAGEVLVEVRAASLCHSDLSVVDGSRPRPLPMVLGHEAAGIVRETGAGVRDLAAGDHVVFSFLPACGSCAPCSAGRPVICERGAKANAAGVLLAGERRLRGGLHHHLGVSGFARHAVAAEESLVKVDADLPAEIAALFGCAVLTGVGAALHAAAIRPGMSVAVFGMGGVGLAAVMGARLAGADPIYAIDPLAEKRALALTVGATHALSGSDSVSRVDVAIEAVGNAKVLELAWAATARGGTTVTVGLPSPDQTLSIPAVSLVGDEKTLKGSYMGSSVPRRDIPRYIALWRDGRLPVDALLTRTLPLSQINEGFDALREGRAVRQVVLPA